MRKVAPLILGLLEKAVDPAVVPLHQTKAAKVAARTTDKTRHTGNTLLCATEQQRLYDERISMGAI